MALAADVDVEILVEEFAVADEEDEVEAEEEVADDVGVVIILEFGFMVLRKSIRSFSIALRSS